MNNVLYLDLVSGISGDMFVGAMLDLGVDFEHLKTELNKLALDEYHLHCDRRHKAQIAGIKFDVHLRHHHQHDHTHADGTRHAHPHEHHQESHAHEAHDSLVHHHPHDPNAITPQPSHSDQAAQPPHGHTHHAASNSGPSHAQPHRTFADIRQLIEQSNLSDWVKQRAVAVFQRIAIAEGSVHGVPPDQVHFHEVGAVDSIVDIVAACVALDSLGRPRVLASRVTEGTGWVRCAHGRFPLPAPATLAILGQRGVPISQCEEPNELVTPTGAALLAEFAGSFEPMQSLVADRIGHGLGSRDNQTRPNILRAILGTSVTTQPTSALDWETDTIAILESNLDDSNAEWLGHFVQRALDAGALDVFHTPVQMKKNRPGVLLTLLCEQDALDRFAELILRETSAFGLRHHTAERRKLRRQISTVSTPFGPVRMKQGLLNGKVLHSTPEFECCRLLANQAGVPLKTIYEAALKADPQRS
jgi:pyridinium-3,5-bisthiocarboxylic acid mononucleotide nickel chelatase